MSWRLSSGDTGLLIVDVQEKLLNQFLNNQLNLEL